MLNSIISKYTMENFLSRNIVMTRKVLKHFFSEKYCLILQCFEKIQVIKFKKVSAS